MPRSHRPIVDHCALLESRRLLAAFLDGNVLRVVGTHHDDTITIRFISHQPEPVEVNVNGFIDTFPSVSIKGVSITGKLGNDSIISRFGKPTTIQGGGGDDHLQHSSKGSALLYGGQGDDTLLGGGGGYTNRMFPDRDTLNGRTLAGNDSVRGGGSDDIVWSDAGSDEIDGNGGINTVRYDRQKSNLRISVDNVANDGVPGGQANVRQVQIIYGGQSDDTLSRASTIWGMAGNDTIKSHGGDNELHGSIEDTSAPAPTHDNDLIEGGQGIDHLYARHGNDTLRGNDGNDQLHSTRGVHQVYGGQGEDAFFASSAASGDQGGLFGEGESDDFHLMFAADQPGIKWLIDGGEDDSDSIIMQSNGLGLELYLGEEIAGGRRGRNDQLSFQNLERFRGSDQNDLFDGSALEGSYNVSARGGDDTLIGSNQNDALTGEGGNDSITGNGGNDNLSGGDQSDTLNGNDGRDTLDAGTGGDLIYGNDGNDLIFGQSGNDRIYGGPGADTIFGGTGGTDSALVFSEDEYDSIEVFLNE